MTKEIITHIYKLDKDALSKTLSIKGEVQSMQIKTPMTVTGQNDYAKQYIEVRTSEDKEV